MTNSHFVGPRWTPATSGGQEQDTLLYILLQTTIRWFLPHTMGRHICPSFPGFFCWFPSPLRNQIPSILVPSLFFNQLTHAFSLSACHLGWWHQGAPLCHWSRYEDEKVKLPSTLTELNLKNKQVKVWACGPSYRSGNNKRGSWAMWHDLGKLELE